MTGLRLTCDKLKSRSGWGLDSPGALLQAGRGDGEVPELGHPRAAGERRKLPEGATGQRLGGEWGPPPPAPSVVGAPERLGHCGRSWG